MLLAALAVAWGAISSFVKLDWWPFLTLIVEGGILYFVVREVTVANLKERKKMKQLQNIDVRYLIPQSHYKLKEYNGAPLNESYPKSLTVGVGSYIVILEFISEVDILFDPIVLLFEGSSDNAPEFLGKDNPFVIKTLPGGMIQDWHGQISHIADKDLRYLYRGDCLIDGNRIVTHGDWAGKLHIRIPIREAMQVDKYLPFVVSKDKDDIPFLKIQQNMITYYDSITNSAKPAATTLTDKTKWK